MANFDLERKSSSNNIIMIGVDEAGRGSWAGPLVATASWIDLKDYKFLHKEINDSKKLTKKKREFLFQKIITLSSDHSWGQSSVREIDEFGIRLSLIHISEPTRLLSIW